MNKEVKYFQAIIKTPIGKIFVMTDGEALYEINFKKLDEVDLITSKDFKLIEKVNLQFEEYFSGIRKEFQLPLIFNRGSVFEKKVWKQLQKIPYGQTMTYGEIAKKIGHLGASRAVGSANRKNPFSLIIPCHRVILSSGEIGQYAGGIKIKKHLIELEKSKK